MNGNSAYITDTSKISTDKMNVTVTNLRPKTSDNDIEVKTEIERKLFDIFKKYNV